MNWIKDAFLDIIVLLLIIAYAFTSNSIVEVILWVYTGMLFLGKTLFFFADFLKSKANKTSVPDWFYHIIYLSSSALLVFSGNYYLATAWVLIWILSVAALITQKKGSKS
jgi:hypothetical protein